MSFRCDRVPGSTFVWHTAVTEKHKWETFKVRIQIFTCDAKRNVDLKKKVVWSENKFKGTCSWSFHG